MTVPTYLHNMDDAHVKALMPGERLDVAGKWRIREFIRPIEGDGFEFGSLAYPNRAAAQSVARMMQIDIAEQCFLGLIAGGTPLMTPTGFVLDEIGADKALATFDRGYALRFPTADEVAEEATNRGF